MSSPSLTAENLHRFGPTLLETASGSIDHGLKHSRPLQVSVGEFPPELRREGASFVTLKIKKRLRGCIGTASAWRQLIEDVAENAFASAFRDGRFSPLSASERKELAITVSVLSPPQDMSFSSESDLLAQLRPDLDGLIIADGGRNALFLPSVWEELSEPEDFLRQLKRKAGLPADHWSDSFTAQRFTALAVSLSPDGVFAAGDR